MTFYEYLIEFQRQYDYVLNPESTLINYCSKIKTLAESYPINFKNEIPFPIMDFQTVKFNEYLINGGIKWNF